MRLRILADPDAVAAAAADAFAAALTTSEGPTFVAALAGGRTPRAAYAHLAARPELPWARARLVLGDERALPDGHPDRNRSMVEATLVRPLGLSPGQVLWLEPGEATLEAAAARAQAGLLEVAGDPPRLELALLGMGADGHTASLFPGQPPARGWVAATEAPPDTAARRRITLTTSTLRRARALLVLVTGADKAAALAATLAGPGPLPLQSILHDRAGEALILVDEAAASALPPDRVSEGRSDD